MKKLVVLSFLMLTFTVSYSGAQCDAGAFEGLLKTKLSKGFEHKRTVTLDKSNMSSGERTMTLSLTKGSLYQIHITNFRGEQKNVVIELYDSSGKMVATNYDSNSGRYWPIGYACRVTGDYQVKIRFQDNPQNCGAFILGERSCSFCE